MCESTRSTTMKIERKRVVSLCRTALFVAAIVLGVVASGWTQLKGGGATIRVAGHAGGGRPISHAAVRVATPLNPNFAPIRYQHLVSVGGSTRPGATTRDKRSFITPIFGFGLPYYYAFDSGYPYDNDAPSDQPPATTLVPAIPDAGEPPYAETEASAEPTEASLPPPELGQLILVRRDGQVVMAVAFTTAGGRLTYITQDGLRRSFPVSELDADATRQMNGVNGTSVALPD